MTRLFIALGLAFGILASSAEFVRDLAAAKIGVAAKVATIGRALPNDLPVWERICGASCPSRALLASASARAAAAHGQAVAQQDFLLDKAESQLQHLTAEEPAAGDAWIELSYVRALRDRGPSDAALAALNHSYEIDRFSRQGALWRLRLASAAWSRLPPSQSRRAIDEAVWLWTIDAHERDRIMGSLTEPSARHLFGERLEQTRSEAAIQAETG